MLRNYKELKVWEKSYKLCLEVYRITKGFPKNELYGLISQMRRAALPIPCNIAEGYGKTTPEYLRALYIAYGSTWEFETQILLSGDLDYLKDISLSKLQGDLKEVERMLKALIKSLENKPLNPWPLSPK